MASPGLSQWLRERLKSERLSLRQAAVKTDVSHGTIADVLRGVSPTAETVRKLARGFGGDGREKLALEDSLLILAGYRTERPDGEEMSPTLGRLLDLMADFSEEELKLMSNFAEFLTNTEAKYGHRTEVSDSDSPSEASLQ